MSMQPWEEVHELQLEMARLREKIERLQDALRRIVQWAEAYPLLDAFSASMGRHVLSGVGDIARKALEGGRQ